MENNAGLTAEERQRAIELIAANELKQQEANPIRAVKDPSKRSNWNVQPPDKIPELEGITADKLQKLELPPLEFIVENMIPVGLIFLGAPAKSFKSYMCLDMCLCACQGFDFMGFKTHKHECLYLDLESTKRRPQTRINQILKGAEAPDGLHIVNEARPIGAGFSEQIRSYIEKHPKIKLVIVDVFKKIRPPKKNGADPYERDYEDYGAIKKIADDLDIAIILVTHTTKMKHPDDPFNELTGSAGTMGSIDVGMVIKKDTRDAEEATLYITGRDLEEQSYKIKFDKASYRWQNIGTTRTVESMRLEYEYRNSPVVQTIIKLVDQNGGRWKGTATDLIKASQFFKGCQIYDNSKKVGKEVFRFSQLLDRFDFIEFHYDRDEDARTYLFTRNNPFEFDESNVSHVIDVSNVSNVSNVIDNE